MCLHLIHVHIMSHHRWQQPSESNSLPPGEKTEEKVLWAVLSRLKLGGSSWKPTENIWKKNHKTWGPPDSGTTQLPVFDYVFYASLLLLSASPCPFKWFYTWKQLPSRKKRTDSKSKLFLKGNFKADIVHVCSKPCHDRCKNYDF